MPSTSKKQHNFMAAVAHSPEFAKKAGVPMSVGKDFISADKGRKFAKGGDTMAKKEMHSEKGEMKADKKQDVALIKKAFKQHDTQEHKGGKGTSLKLANGGPAVMPSQANMGGAARGLDRAAAMSGRTMPVTGMKNGGYVRSADGIAQRGKTKGTMVAMKRGGMCK